MRAHLPSFHSIAKALMVLDLAAVLLRVFDNSLRHFLAR